MNKYHEHNHSIDGLRALSCLLVVIFHASQKSGLIDGGYIGVDIFFVLSGLLITRLLRKELEVTGKIRKLKFLYDRALRLFPALFLFLLTYILISPLIWPDHPHGRDALVTAFYFSDYAYAYWGIPSYLGHSWSLSVEEKFYLLWPLALPIIIASQRPIIVIIALYLISTAIRYSLIGQPSQLAYFPMHAHMSGLLLGSILAFVNPEEMNTKFNLYVYFFTILLITIIFASSTHQPIFPITAAEICSAVIIMHLLSPSQSKLKFWLSGPLIGWLGKISYALYLWHFPFALYFRENYSGFWATTYTLAFGIPCAALSYYTVEKWGRSQKEKLRARETARF